MKLDILLYFLFMVISIILIDIVFNGDGDEDIHISGNYYLNNTDGQNYYIVNNSENKHILNVRDYYILNNKIYIEREILDDNYDDYLCEYVFIDIKSNTISKLDRINDIKYINKFKYNNNLNTDYCKL